MIDFENRTIKSERLTYRLLNETDKEALYEIISDKDVAAPAGFLPPNSKEKFDVFFTTLTQHNTGIAILSGETLMGYIHVYPYDDDLPEYREKKGVNIGFVVGKIYQNNGYATETLKTITAYLKQKFDFCIADHFVGNEASRKVIEKSGYHYFETYTMFFDELGKEMTCFSYVC
ncbi:MAG: GNAT family N-acetyltransferase [Corallococcus sp.]|nr:GNAT family N-acetyltransferase [Corallococcus sp.]MCM1358975.1 GNAT family N-acetyltransferase [Corallococcus sp.]MCM1394964.1 GNAT family N-acetyltransferase [Corallococcus sp.]